jgi:multiple sugar transport system permease protein
VAPAVHDQAARERQQIPAVEDPTSPTVLRPTANRRRRRTRDLQTAIVFLLPGFLGLLLFLIGPLVASFLLSLTNWRMMGTTQVVGLRNYSRLLTVDPVFWQVLRVTILYTVQYLVLNLVIAVALATWIGSLRWGKTLFRLVFFLPTFMPLIGVAVVWQLMLTPGGAVDWGLQALHLPIPNLITTPPLALQAVVAVSLWSHVGYNMLLFGAALEAIPSSYLEAAIIDGATHWQRFWKIKLPLISPALFFGSVLTGITSLQTFDQVYALTHGGPGSATTTLGFAIYTNGFVNYQFGYASAIAWVLFAIIMMLTAVQLRLQHRWVHYDL